MVRLTIAYDIPSRVQRPSGWRERVVSHGCVAVEIEEVDPVSLRPAFEVVTPVADGGFGEGRQSALRVDYVVDPGGTLLAPLRSAVPELAPRSRLLEIVPARAPSRNAFLTAALVRDRHGIGWPWRPFGLDRNMGRYGWNNDTREERQPIPPGNDADGVWRRRAVAEALLYRVVDGAVLRVAGEPVWIVPESAGGSPPFVVAACDHGAAVPLHKGRRMAFFPADALPAAVAWAALSSGSSPADVVVSGSIAVHERDCVVDAAALTARSVLGAFQLMAAAQMPLVPSAVLREWIGLRALLLDLPVPARMTEMYRGGPGVSAVRSQFTRWPAILAAVLRHGRFNAATETAFEDLREWAAAALAAVPDGAGFDHQPFGFSAEDVAALAEIAA